MQPEGSTSSYGELCPRGTYATAGSCVACRPEDIKAGYECREGTTLYRGVPCYYPLVTPGHGVPCASVCPSGFEVSVACRSGLHGPLLNYWCGALLSFASGCQRSRACVSWRGTRHWRILETSPAASIGHCGYLMLIPARQWAFFASTITTARVSASARSRRTHSPLDAPPSQVGSCDCCCLTFVLVVRSAIDVSGLSRGPSLDQLHSSLGWMTSLTALRLSRVGLVGSLPDSVGNLTNLQ
jgi:hypothetical protein